MYKQNSKVCNNRDLNVLYYNQNSKKRYNRDLNVLCYKRNSKDNYTDMHYNWCIKVLCYNRDLNVLCYNRNYKDMNYMTYVIVPLVLTTTAIL